MTKIFQRAKEYEEQLVQLRRHFHQHPEISGKEVETSKKVKELLAEHGIPYQEVGTHSVLATIEGAKPGRTFMLRADMDALSVTEENDLPYRSCVEGVMHACGHDIHTTMLLGAAFLLEEMKEEICGTVKLIFQEAEEHLAGARLLCSEGILDGVDGIFAIHVSESCKAGQIQIDKGPRTSSACSLHITIHGKAGHSSQPQTGIDAMVVGAAMLLNLQTIVSRSADPKDFLVVHVGKFTSGTQENIIADYAKLDGSIRYFDKKYGAILEPIISRIVHQTAAAYGATADLDFRVITDPVVNDPEIEAIAEEAAATIIKPEDILHPGPRGGSEDFAYYLRHVPGALAFLGIQVEGREDTSLHSGKMLFDESVIPYGVALHVQTALDYLKQTSI